MSPSLALTPLASSSLAPSVFAGSAPRHRVILSGPADQPRVTEGPPLRGEGNGPRPDLQIAACMDSRLHPHPPPPPAPSLLSFARELKKSIRASLCLKSHSEADEHLCPSGWSLSLWCWLASRRCEALTHSCPISRGLMLRLILSK